MRHSTITYEESDLLEEWNTELNSTEDDPIASFESWIRGGDPKRQSLLKTPQERAHVRPRNAHRDQPEES